MLPPIRPEHIADPDYDPVFGQPAKPAPTPQRAIVDQSYLVFAHGAGAVVLDDLIRKYVAAPVFDANRDAAKGYERNGEANVVRWLVQKLTEAQDAIQRGT